MLVVILGCLHVSLTMVSLHVVLLLVYLDIVLAPSDHLCPFGPLCSSTFDPPFHPSSLDMIDSRGEGIPS